MRIFMEYTTEEEPPTSPPTSRRPLPTTVQTWHTTFIYTPAEPRNTPLPPTLDITQLILQTTSEIQTNSAKSFLTNSDKGPDSSSNGTSFTPGENRITRGVSNTAIASAEGDHNNRSIPSTPTLTSMEASQPSSFLSRGAIIGISVSVIVSGFLLAAVVLRRYRSSRRLTEGGQNPLNCINAVESNSGHPDGPVANTQDIAMYETVPNDVSKRTKLSGATQGNKQSNVPMYESTAYVSITKKSCDLTESSAYGTNSDTN
ncbi:uncharacterized protein LOC135812519 [Sycon ciliatum]|uniref:uncharacterized protein LOC135812519 n=1 Tax=Sycon ciliatum TaxID=27933 RepID=UPI0031F68B06